MNTGEKPERVNVKEATSAHAFWFCPLLQRCWMTLFVKTLKDAFNVSLRPHIQNATNSNQQDIIAFISLLVSPTPPSAGAWSKVSWSSPKHKFTIFSLKTRCQVPMWTLTQVLLLFMLDITDLILYTFNGSHWRQNPKFSFFVKKHSFNLFVRLLIISDHHSYYVL